jgi:hypothetical protein
MKKEDLLKLGYKFYRIGERCGNDKMYYAITVCDSFGCWKLVEKFDDVSKCDRRFRDILNESEYNLDDNGSRSNITKKLLYQGYLCVNRVASWNGNTYLYGIEMYESVCNCEGFAMEHFANKHAREKRIAELESSNDKVVIF